MLVEIKNWILSNSTHQVEMNESEYTSSLVVDFENENKIARFTVWDDKSCMLEVMDVDTGGYIINERRELSEISEIIESFKEFNDFVN
ncbi:MULTISPECIES: immunity protein TriTu family protein [Pectobacterium]|uniref:Uncharacterized protein n=1 Tax=Pectobacterium brasiliense TaxID=180957 RepID=A0A0M2EVA9_9GAMM|nr:MULTISPECIES: hypothetical protein [Pectobacterium]KGA27993.1 hypothetical protein KU74_22365 [Pectobacterium brasiliense]KMK79719.1 hypothetical protein KCO_22159 [Pectobacterium brasiliense ICMP 19477]MCL6331825.1 hypothetical protein [Pectobacterium carotovorum subsp. carotovorum]